MSRFTEQNDHPVISAINVIINDKGEVLLGRRIMEPDKGKWGLIGGRMEMTDDNIESTALREMKEETGLQGKLLHLVDVVGDPYLEPPADPRFYTVQIVYETAIVKGDFLENNEIGEVKWFSLEKAIQVCEAYDHKSLLEIYQQKKAANKLISPERTYYTDYYGKEFDFISNDYVHFVVKGLVLNEKNEILLGKRSQKPELNKWDLPGGHMTWIESVKACLQREIKEELNVECEVGDLFQVYSDRGQTPRFHRVVALYFTKLKSAEFSTSIEMNEFKYFSLDNLPSEIAYHYGEALNDLNKYLKNKI